MKSRKLWNLSQSESTIMLMLISIIMLTLTKQLLGVFMPALSTPRDAPMINKYYYAVMAPLFLLFYHKSSLDIEIDALKVKDKAAFRKMMREALIICAIILVCMIVCRFFMNRVNPVVAARPNFGLYLRKNGRWFYPASVFIQEFIIKPVCQHNLRSVCTPGRKHLHILLSSLFFTILHMNFRLYYMTASFLLCLFTGYIYERDRNIYGSFLIHFVLGFMPRALGLR